MPSGQHTTRRLRNFLTSATSLGFLVMDEAFDEWEVQKGQVEYSYHLYFAENSQSDLLSMIHRDRNHPSVVLWSAGNEVSWTREPTGASRCCEN
jgi:beta-galactosidase